MRPVTAATAVTEANPTRERDVDTDQKDSKDKDGQDQQGSSAPPDTGAGSSPSGDVDEVAKWKAMSRKHEAQAKANADAARRLQELEDASKSEGQKLTERTTAAEKAAAAAQGELLRLRVAMRKGLTEAQAKRLVGATEEELEADADELLTSFGQKNSGGDDGAAAGKPTRPKERLRSGASAGGESSDGNQAINQSIRQAIVGKHM